MPRQGIEEPGFWSWQHLYVDALTGTGRLDEAEAFLRPREELADPTQPPIDDGPAGQVPGPPRGRDRRHRRGDGRLRVRSSTTPSSYPCPSRRPSSNSPGDRSLRRDGQRRLAAERLRGAADIFTALQRPTVPRTHRTGTDWPAAWHRHDARTTTPTGSPPTSWRWRTWSVKGMSNRQIAAEIMVSVKTVQAHLTKIYAKVGVTLPRRAGRPDSSGRSRPDADTRTLDPPNDPPTQIGGVWPTRTTGRPPYGSPHE